MALVNPNIAMSYRGLQLPPPVNALAQATQLMQIQQAQAQMDEYARARQEEETLRNYLSANQDITSPTFRAGLMGYGKPGRDVYKNLTEQDKAAVEQAKSQLELAQKTETVYRNMSNIIQTKDDAIKFISRMFNDPNLKGSPITQMPIMEYVRQIPEDPAGLDEWKKKFAVGAVKWAELNKLQFFAQGERGVVSVPGMGGQATVVPGTPYTKPPTPADILARQRFAFDQMKFQLEQQYPGFDFKEDENNDIFAINKKTGQAFPVQIGQEGAAGAPGVPLPAPAMTAPNALAPQAPVNAMVPGAQPPMLPAYSRTAMPAAISPAAMPAAAPPSAMPGVIQQQQAPAVAPVPTTAPERKQLRGKGAGAMTEAQSNSALFGGSMAQAQRVISELEKSGTAKNAVLPSVLTGLASLVPFGVGENLGNVINSTFNSDPTKWAGPNEAQQRLAQAQLAFAMAWLRKTSGAAFGASEVSNTIKEYFPLIGDTEKVIRQKAAARKRAIEGLKISTTKEGKKYIESYENGDDEVSDGTKPDPLGIR